MERGVRSMGRNGGGQWTPLGGFWFYPPGTMAACKEKDLPPKVICPKIAPEKGDGQVGGSTPHHSLGFPCDPGKARMSAQQPRAPHEGEQDTTLNPKK